MSSNLDSIKRGLVYAEPAGMTPRTYTSLATQSPVQMGHRIVGRLSWPAPVHIMLLQNGLGRRGQKVGKGESASVVSVQHSRQAAVGRVLESQEPNKGLGWKPPSIARTAGEPLITLRESSKIGAPTSVVFSPSDASVSRIL